MKRFAPYASAADRLRFVLVSSAVALSLLGDALLYALLPARPGHFHVLVWQVGILLGVNRIVRLLTNELAGRLVHRRGGRGPLLWAVVLGSAITAGYALPLGFWGLLAARVLWGACWSVFRVEGYLAALAVSSGTSRGRVFGTYQAVTRLGQGGGVLVGGLLSDLIGIPRVFLLFAVCTLVGLALIVPLPDRPSKAGTEPIPSPAKRRPGRRPQAKWPSLPRLRSDFTRFLRRQPLALWAGALALTMVEQMGANLVGRFAAERIGPALQASGAGPAVGVAGLTGLLLSFRSFGSLVLAPAAGWLGDRLGRRPLLVGLITIQVFTFAALTLLRTWQLLLGVLLLQLACGAAAYLMVYTLAGDRVPPAGAALHLSRFSTFVDLGTALGPVAAFALYARFGFSAVALLAWLLLAAAFVALRRYGAAEPRGDPT